MPPKPKEDGLIFVGGPTLMEKTGLIRSKLLQKAHRQNKTQQRQNATLERKLLMEGGKSAFCICRQDATALTAQALISSQSTGYRSIRPRISVLAEGKQDQLCPFCGKPPAPRSQASTMQAWDIGAGSFDPMIPKDETTSLLRVQETLHYACTSIWPGFRPLAYATNCYQSWVFPYDNKVQLYAILWSASYHRDVLNTTYGGSTYQAGSRQQLIFKGMALESLRKEVEIYDGTKPIDSIIMCILYLAVNETADPRIYRDRTPFNPPFRHLHALDLYGSRDYHPAHWSIIQTLLSRYGGVEVIHQFGLAWLLSLSDLMGAVHTLQKPIYPCMGIHGKRLVLEPPLVLFEPYASHFAGHTAGIGFNELLLLNAPIKQHIVATFSHIGQLSCVLEYYARESCNPEVFDILGDCRNYTHYNLFSLPEGDSLEDILQQTDQELDTMKLSQEIYSTCRLALLLYATHVTFPIPRSAVVRRPLLQRIYPKLQTLANKNISTPLILWCVSVVLIALDVDSEEPMLVLFQELCCKLEVNSLNGLLVLLRRFAWMDKAVEHHYHRLSEVVGT